MSNEAEAALIILPLSTTCSVRLAFAGKPTRADISFLGTLLDAMATRGVFPDAAQQVGVQPYDKSGTNHGNPPTDRPVEPT